MRWCHRGHNRAHLDQVDADHFTLAWQALEDFKHLVIEKAAVARGAGAGRDGRVEAVDIDGAIVAHAIGDAVEHALGSEFADFANGQNIRSRRAGRRIVFAIGR